MFEQTFIASRATVRGPWPVAASLALQTGFVAAVLAVPLFQTVTMAWKPPAPIIFLPVKPKVVEVVEKQLANKQAVNLQPATRRVFIVPKGPAAPRAATVTENSLEPAPYLPTGIDAGYKDPFVGIAGQMIREVPAPKPPAAPSHSKPSMVRVGTGVQAAKLIHQVKPVYPSLARTARVSGTVHLQAIIGTDGHIRNLQLLGGPALLIEAALAAVKLWQYEPTLLNGEPVEVITSIEVNFILGQ